MNDAAKKISSMEESPLKRIALRLYTEVLLIRALLTTNKRDAAIERIGELTHEALRHSLEDEVLTQEKPKKPAKSSQTVAACKKAYRKIST